MGSVPIGDCSRWRSFASEEGDWAEWKEGEEAGKAYAVEME